MCGMMNAWHWLKRLRKRKEERPDLGIYIIFILGVSVYQNRYYQVIIHNNIQMREKWRKKRMRRLKLRRRKMRAKAK